MKEDAKRREPIVKLPVLKGIKNFLKYIFLCAVSVALAAAIGTAALMVVFRIPVDRMSLNMERSAEILREEGSYYHVFPWCQSQLDNWTDSVILLEASDPTVAPARERAMMVYRGEITGEYPCDALVDHFGGGVPFTNTAAYARYWHGFLVFLKPLLCVMSYGGIRLLNGTLQGILCLIICLLLWKRRLKNCIVPYLLIYASLMPVVLAMSLQFSSCYYVASAAMIGILLLPEKVRNKWGWIVFLFAGILTAYFDFLTYPMVTFGMPAVVFLVLEKKDRLPGKLLLMIRNGISWCWGFGGMWVSKWYMAAWITGQDVFEEARKSFELRTSSVSAAGDETYSVLACEKLNYLTFMKNPFSVLLLAVILVLLVKAVKAKRLGTAMIPFLLLALAPVVWHGFAVNHSMVHYWFTYRCCVISFMALLFGLIASGVPSGTGEGPHDL